MMLIKFAVGEDWYKANWVFDQFLLDVDDSVEVAVRDRLERAAAYGMLDLRSMDEESQNLLIVMGARAEAILSRRGGAVPHRFDDDVEGYRMYLDAMEELRARIAQQSGSE
jgi:hypothetical protein